MRLFTKGVGRECAMGQTGIRVNSVHPGIIDTAIWGKMAASMELSGLGPGTPVCGPWVGTLNNAGETVKLLRPEDPLKAKQLQKGLKELGEEGAVQVFTNELGRRLLGAVGRLQFDIVAHRLKGEYNVDALYEPSDIYGNY